MPDNPPRRGVFREWETCMHEARIERIRSRDAVVGVVGLGYVGLPLVLTFAEAGFSVRGWLAAATSHAGTRVSPAAIHHAAATLPSTSS